jgi:sugar O-acyltransferase (sialic acid O-acetyltransferase NeuD family)
MDTGEPWPLLIFPSNGNGVEALHCLGVKFHCIGFVDDAPEKQGSDWHGYRVFGRSALNDFQNARILAVPGSPTSFRSRKEVITGLGLNSERFACVIHPAATVAPWAKIGYNVLIMAGVVITSNCVIGNHVCILPNTVIHHDVIIGDWSLIGSNVTIAGGANIEDNCYIGSGSSIRNGLNLGTGALLGLGCTLINDVPRGATVVGNPARPIQ